MARILVVEDDTPTRRALTRLMGLDGHQIVEADSVAAALGHVNEHFDILISDIMLPDGTGWDVVRSMEQAGNKPRMAIAITGSVMENEMLHSTNAGFCAQLTKPIRFGMLERFLEECREELQSGGGCE